MPVSSLAAYDSTMRIALAQINPTVGDIVGNSAKIFEFAARAKAAGAEAVAFGELTLCGYPPKDLLLKPSFVADNLAAVERIAARVDDINVIIGYADRNPAPVGRALFNAAAVLQGGSVTSRHFKTLLPTYDVFDESRYFEPGPRIERSQLISLAGAQAGLSICEDLWNDERLISRRLYHENPIADLDAAGAEMMINISASPFVAGKQDFRIALFGSQARQFANPLVYVNQVGGNDELVFDGNSMVFDAAGRLIARAKDFEEDLLVVDVPLGDASAGVAARDDVMDYSKGIEALYHALVLGLRDYAAKCGFKSVVLGLSGGIDSALTAAIAVDALGRDSVMGVAMPSRYSSGHSVSDAQELAANLGIRCHLVPIDPAHTALESMLAPAFKGLKPDVTEENLQARVRGATLMAFSNKFGSLLLTTGNKSEIAVGYCTLYGDMCGGLAVISDVPKTTVWDISRYINQRAGRFLIPENTIDKPPSAELRPNQTDQDSLPPYDVLDAILYRYVEEEKGVREIIDEGYDAATVTRVIQLVDFSEYKRRQAAPGLKVTSRAFGFGRRMPIAQRYSHVVRPT